ncbi:MAG: hypothetical protein IPH30_17030, partial [Betaproteobacteria bacterium]|nr:hypothetical protein [Betaproteobacteria bacterium]
QVDAACRAITDELAVKKAPAPVNAIRTRDATRARHRPRGHGGDAARAIRRPGSQRSGTPFSSHRAIDMARDLLELRGVSTRGLSRDEILERGFHSTSDFPNLLANVGNKFLRQGYLAAPPGTKVIARQVLARDFKPLSRIQFGEAPALQKVLEGGEFKRGKMVDAKETAATRTSAREPAPRSRPPRSRRPQGDAPAARTRRRDADQCHGALPHRAGDARIHRPAARGSDHAEHRERGQPLRRQARCGCRCPPRCEFDDGLVSGSRSGSNRRPRVRLPRGQPGVQLVMQEGWDRDGIEWKARLDFGAAAVEYRGLYKANGA